MATDSWTSDSSTSFRYLLRFDNLGSVLPASASITGAALTFSFTNWQAPVDVVGCFLSVPWQETVPPGAPRFAGTGWQNRGYYNGANAAWTQPGGWSDCDASRGTVTFPAVSNGGLSTQTVQLDPSVVQAWLTGNNYGMLFRAASGQVRMGSTTSTAIGQKPKLTIQYN